ncbi:hypothetical protein WA026_022928 [Henosepilachna vigintioctopunctata]|uniref:Secreted protein n=1 Tax=Henosepilachna vigintioctopunctata TaxID=420089 RepID=A0AAW1TZ74_9CUCU
MNFLYPVLYMFMFLTNVAVKYYICLRISTGFRGLSNHSKHATSALSTSKHFHCFCKKCQTKFPKHLELKYRSENGIKIFSLPNKSVERQTNIRYSKKNLFTTIIRRTSEK